MKKNEENFALMYLLLLFINYTSLKVFVVWKGIGPNTLDTWDSTAHMKKYLHHKDQVI